MRAREYRAIEATSVATLQNALQSVDTATAPRWQAAAEARRESSRTDWFKTSRPPKLLEASVRAIAQAKLRTK